MNLLNLFAGTKIKPNRVCSTMRKLNVEALESRLLMDCGLLIESHISADRRFVRLIDLSYEQMEVHFIAHANPPACHDGDHPMSVAAIDDFFGQFGDDDQDSAGASGKKAGGTQKGGTAGPSDVPLLSELPYDSRLFRNMGVGRERQELQLMVTPRIIIAEEGA